MYYILTSYIIFFDKLMEIFEINQIYYEKNIKYLAYKNIYYFSSQIFIYSLILILNNCKVKVL